VKRFAKLGLAVLTGGVLAFALWKGVSHRNHRNRRQDIAEALKLRGYEEDDAGRIILTPDSSGLALAYDPNLYDPTIGFRACMTRIATCLSPSRGADACVKAAPRCVSSTPWKNDPAGDDCCPESCVQEYFEMRKTQPETTALPRLADGTCYPGMREQIRQLGGK